jgi:hypothetical protein
VEFECHGAHDAGIKSAQSLKTRFSGEFSGDGRVAVWRCLRLSFSRGVIFLQNQETT